MTLQTTATIAGEVRALAAKQRAKQTDLANVLNMHPMAVSRRMRGEVSFTAEEMVVLAEFFGVPVCALYGELAGHVGATSVLAPAPMRAEERATAA